MQHDETDETEWRLLPTRGLCILESVLMTQPRVTKLSHLLLERRLELGQGLRAFAALITVTAREKAPELTHLGVSPSMLSRIEKGHMEKLTFRAIRTISLYFDCPPQRILDLSQKEAANADSRRRDRNVREAPE